MHPLDRSPASAPAAERACTPDSSPSGGLEPAESASTSPRTAPPEATASLLQPRPTLLIASCCAAVLASVAALAGPPPVFELLPLASPAPVRSADGAFVLRAPGGEPIARGGALALTAAPTATGRSAGSCFCARLFADGFESGDTGLWSSVSP